MWYYVFYKAYIETLDEKEYDGNELFVSKKINSNDITWIPIRRTKLLNLSDEDEEQKLNQLFA